MTPLKPGPAVRVLLLLIAPVLMAHWACLVWLQAQVQAIPPLTRMAQPLFTRIIAPATAVAPVHHLQPGSSPAYVGPKSVKEFIPTISADTTTASTPSHPEALPDGAGQVEVSTSTSTPTNADSVADAPSDTIAPDPALTTQSGDDWPADTRVSYRMTGYIRGELHGSGRVQWQREQDRYQVRVDMLAALVFRVSMISQGRVTKHGLVPGAYEEQLPGRRQGVAFEAESLRFQDGTRQLKPHAVQDTASQFVELSRRFSTGREVLKVGGEASVWLARPSGMALWTYDVVAEDTLQTPELGPVQAFHLKPRPIANARGVITAELWFAPALQYLPVRVRISLGSENYVDLLVERIEQADAHTPQTPGGLALP